MIRNGMDFLGLSAKKDGLEKGKEDARSQANLYKTKKKNGINLKRIWYQPYSAYSSVNCFKFLSRMFRRCKNLRQAGNYAETLALLF